MSVRRAGAPASRVDDLLTLGEARELLRPKINEQAAAYTFAATDIGQAVHSTSSGAVTHTVPTAANAGWTVGVVIVDAQMGTGQVTLAGASGVTLLSSASLTTRTRYSEVSLRYLGADTWLAAGDLT